jgi:hypothetical protein
MTFFDDYETQNLTTQSDEKAECSGGALELVIKSIPYMSFGIILVCHRQNIAGDETNDDDRTKMVRTSRRSVRIAELKAKVAARTQLRMLSLMDDDDDDEEDSDDDFRDEMLLINTYLDMCLKRRLKRAIRARYLTRSVYRRYGYDQFGDDYRDDEHSFLNNTEFLQKYRMKRSSFDKLLGLIKDHPIFQRFVLEEMLALM